MKVKFFLQVYKIKKIKINKEENYQKAVIKNT